MSMRYEQRRVQAGEEEAQLAELGEMRGRVCWVASVDHVAVGVTVGLLFRSEVAFGVDFECVGGGLFRAVNFREDVHRRDVEERAD